MTILNSPHVRARENGSVVELSLPDGNTLRLSPEQAVEATVERHGNHGRSSVVVTLRIEAEVMGDVDVVRQKIKTSLAREVLELREKVSSLKQELNTARAKP